MIDPSQVLPISIEEYYRWKHLPGDQVSFDRFLSEYDLVGVHWGTFTTREGWAIDTFCQHVPREAEAVVNYKCTTSAGQVGAVIHQIGVALVPKKK